MIDINLEAEKAFEKLGNSDVYVYYQYPEAFNEMPCISWYNLTETPGLSCDNEETTQKGWIQVDIWAKKPQDLGVNAIRVHQALKLDGWSREMSCDLPQEDGIFHKSMRYAKEFIL